MSLKHFLIFTFLVFTISSCAEPQAIDACVQSEPSGFWLGLIQGVISPVTFIISLFSDGVVMYDVNNNGAWYDFGFVLGAGILFGGSGKAKR